MNIDMCKCELL